MSCFASLDLGSNTFRILCAKFQESSPGYEILFTDRIVVRMSEDVTTTKSFTENAIERGISALQKFSLCLNKCEAYRAVATGVFREVSNADFFLEESRKIGVEVEIISPAEEAELSFKGAINDIGVPENETIFLDIGGGSFEVGMKVGKKFVWDSIPWGAVKLIEKFSIPAPSEPAHIYEVKEFLVERWDKVYNKFKIIPHIGVVTGGTITTLVMLQLKEKKYKRSVFNGFRIAYPTVDSWIKRLSGLSVRDRAKLAGMERGRENIILTGLLILETFMERFNLTFVINSEGGLLEGVLLSLKERSNYA